MGSGHTTLIPEVADQRGMGGRLRVSCCGDNRPRPQLQVSIKPGCNAATFDI